VAVETRKIVTNPNSMATEIFIPKKRPAILPSRLTEISKSCGLSVVMANLSSKSAKKSAKKL
jgi:hypothetical protein